MLQIGDTVVVMSAKGRFEIVAVNGYELVIQNSEGLRKTVLAQAVRQVQPAAAPKSDAVP